MPELNQNYMESSFIRVEDLLKSKNLFSLCTAFFNINDESDEAFFIKISYRNSKFSKLLINENLLIKNNSAMMEATGLPFFVKNRIHTCLIRKNADVNDRDSLLKNLYSKIQQCREFYNDEQFTNVTCAALFFLRGSFDFTAQYLAVDIYRKNSSSSYYSQILNLTTNLWLENVLNLNFREFQKGYRNGKRRNTQIRLKLSYLSDNEELINLLRRMNPYKFEIFIGNKEKIKAAKIKDSNAISFPDRVISYMNEILNKTENKNQENVEELHSYLWDIIKKNKKEKIKKSRRADIVKIAKRYLPDYCSGCFEKYDIKDRTFKYKNSKKWYLEINHVVSFANNNVDQFDNLCKLCPACHRALTPKRADEVLQKSIIESILKNNESVFKYVQNFTGTSNVSTNVSYVFEKLK